MTLEELIQALRGCREPARAEPWRRMALHLERIAGEPCSNPGDARELECPRDRGYEQCAQVSNMTRPLRALAPAGSERGLDACAVIHTYASLHL